jgi:hypothetical protein
MDQKSLFDAILGNKPEAFQKIWPTYKQFLESTNVSEKAEIYFLDKQQLINDFFRWLSSSGHREELTAIDRRSGTDRRGDGRPDAPGRRQSDIERRNSIDPAAQIQSPSPFAKKE